MGFTKTPEKKDKRRYPYGYTTDELKVFMGDFEKYYNEACVGKKIRNSILGNTFEGVLKYAIEFGAITERDGAHFIGYNNFEIWNRQYQAMKELQSRRAFAQRKENERLDNIGEQFVKEKEILVENLSVENSALDNYFGNDTMAT